MKIYKYSLKLTEQQTITASIVKVLDIQFQDDIPCLWAIVDDTETEIKSEPYNIVCCGTGLKLHPNFMNYKYISTTQSYGFVWHWFIV